MHLRLLFALVLAALFAPPAASAQDAPPAGDFRPGVALVGFQSGAAVASVDALRAAGYEVAAELPDAGVVAVNVPVGQEAAAAEQLARLPGVAFAEPDYWAAPQSDLAPNDPYFAEQWGLPRIGAPAAWNATTGAANVVIAVIDSGVALKHEDLAGKLWVNKGETPFNGKDDDGNGKIDDVNGWHFYQAWNGQAYESRENNLVADDSGHGTHVAGIAAAQTNNAAGIAGVAWHSPVMVVKVIDKTIGLAAYSDVAAGILYAANNGAAVINLSLGGSAASQTLCAAVSAAANKGKIIVAAAGNKDSSVYYPAACPGALAVGATDRDDNAAAFTNPGAAVSLAAPGVDILSTWYLSGLPGSGSAYATLSGTSEAAPHVAGAAALVWARWPGLSADGVMAQLQGSVVDVGQPGRDDETGWGRLDLARALAEPVQPVDLRLSAVAQPDSVIAGNAMTATFTITNTGASPATSVTLSATLPAEPIFEGVHVASSDCSLKGSELRCGIARLDSRAVISMTVVMTPTIVGDGALTTAASANAAQRELTPSDNRQTIITPIRPVLGGRIFLDGNGDGIRQPWETSGIPNAWVLLEQDGQPVAYTSSQSPTGLFQFDMLPSGNYTVIAELPGEYQLTTQGQVEIAVNARLQQTVYIGAWTGQVAPIPGRVYLPVVVAGR